MHVLAHMHFVRQNVALFAGLYYGTKLQYLAIEVNTTMNVYSVGYQEGMPVYFKWEELVNDMVCLF